MGCRHRYSQHQWIFPWGTLIKFKPALYTTRLLLSRITLADAVWLFDLIQRNQDHLAQHLVWANGVTSLEKEKALIQDMMLDWNREKRYCLGIKTVHDYVGIGTVSVIEIHQQNRSCELGYWLASEHQSKGYASEALDAIEQECFHLGLKQVHLKIDCDNYRSINLAVRNNYIFFEVNKGDFCINNQIKDTLIFQKKLKKAIFL